MTEVTEEIPAVAQVLDGLEDVIILDIQIRRLHVPPIVIPVVSCRAPPLDKIAALLIPIQPQHQRGYYVPHTQVVTPG